jgi:hypothetical protein
MADDPLVLGGHVTSRDYQTAVEALCRLPLDVTALELSAKEAIRRSGYRNISGILTERDLAGVLAKRPDLVEAWVRWAEDKRTSRGWYLARRGNRDFEVGYFDGRATLASQIIADPVQAAAYFAYRELADIA